MLRLFLALSLLFFCCTKLPLKADSEGLYGIDSYYWKLTSEKSSIQRKTAFIAFHFHIHSTPSCFPSFHEQFIAHFGFSKTDGKGVNGLQASGNLFERWVEERLGYALRFYGQKMRLYSGLGYYALDDRWDEGFCVMRVKNLYIPLGIFYPCAHWKQFKLSADVKCDIPTWIEWKIEGHPVIHARAQPLKRIPVFHVELPLSWKGSVKGWKLGVQLSAYGRWARWEKRSNASPSFPFFDVSAYGARFLIGVVG